MADESNIQSENYTSYLHYFEQKIQQNQNDSISLFGKGMCLSALNRNKEAIDSYKAALHHILPHDAITYYIKGTLHYIFFELDKAIACFKQAIEQDANLAMAYNGLGKCLRRQNKYNEAIDEFKKAIKRDEYDGGGDYLKIQSKKRIQAQATNNQGNCLRRLNKLDEAILCYNQALELDEMYAEAFNNKGLCLFEQHKFNEAYILFEKAISIDFYYAHAHYNKGNCLRYLKRRNEAILSFDSALAINETYVKAMNNKGICLIELNKPMEALTCFTNAILLEQNYQLAKENRNILRLVFPNAAANS